MTNIQITKIIEDCKIIAIARCVPADKAVSLANALYDGGIRVLEFPFNMKDVESTVTDEAIKAVCEAMGDKMIVGCGTCSYVELVDRTYKAGGRFVISADMNPQVIKRTRELGMISIPGVATATEAMTAVANGADYIKVFPAHNLGADYIKALKAPFPHLKFFAVGGVDSENMDEFLSKGCSGVGIGGSLVKSDWIENGEFDKITEAASKLVKAASRR